MATNRQRIQRRRLFLRRLGKPVREDDGNRYRYSLHNWWRNRTRRENAERNRPNQTHSIRRANDRFERFVGW